MPNVVTVLNFPPSVPPLAQCVVRPLTRESCGIRGVVVDNIDSGDVVASTGFRLGTSHLLSAPGGDGFRASARDTNGMWSEWSEMATPSLSPFSGGATEASIGSGATTDLDIQSPGIVFPDLSHGSSRMSVRRTLVGAAAFLDETTTQRWPRQRASFTVKMDSLGSDEARLIHRFWRALNGPQRTFFFDYVEPADGHRTTGTATRYHVRFRDGKLSDSLFGHSYHEMQFVLIEVPDCPAGGDTYEYQPPSGPTPAPATAPPHYIDTNFQFEPRSLGLDQSPRWMPTDTPAHAIQVQSDETEIGFVGYTVPTNSGVDNRVIYAEPARVMHQRVGIEFSQDDTDADTRTGVLLRYLDPDNYVVAWVQGDGNLVVTEFIASVGTATTIGLSVMADVTFPNALQVEVIGNRLRWWFEAIGHVVDRPPDGAFDLAGVYDDTFNGWGIYQMGTAQRLLRFIACEVPGAILPPPQLTVSDASDAGFNLTPVRLTLTTDLDTVGREIEWEMLPADPADYPEPYRAATLATGTSHTVFVRPGYAYKARARLTQTPWSEYIDVSVGSSSGSGWASQSQQLTDWPTEAYTTGSSPVLASYSFPPVLADYVLEGSGDASAVVLTSNLGADVSQTMDRRPRRTFVLKFEHRTVRDYQRVIDFFEFAQAKNVAWNWTHPITGEAFILRFNADDYERQDTDQSHESASGIVSVAFACIEAPPAGAIVPTYAFGLQVDPALLAP